MKQFGRMIDGRQEKLQLKAKNSMNPTLVLVKITPKHTDHDENGIFKIKRRDFNYLLTQWVQRTPKTLALNIDKIVPFQKEQFTVSGMLSQVGYQIFWDQLNVLISKIDGKVGDPRITTPRLPSSMLKIDTVIHHTEFQGQGTFLPTNYRGRGGFRDENHRSSGRRSHFIRGRGRGQRPSYHFSYRHFS